MEEKKITSNDLIISLGSEDFRKYFRRNILPFLEPIERLRVELRKKRSKITCIAGSVAILLLSLLYWPFFTTFKDTPAFLFTFFHASIMYTAAIVSVWVFANIYAKKKFKESTGKKIIPVLFSYWGTFKYCNAPIYTCGDIDKLIKSLRLYRSYNSTAIDDCIEGEYNGLNLKIVELDLQDKAEDSAEQIFDGLMMEVDIYKNFTSHTIIKPDKAFRETRELKRVILEDPEFEKEFDVYSNDQVDSRYILTTAFMRRLVELKMSVKKRVEVVFYNQKAYFFIDYREDKFELPINKPVTDMQHYQNILLDLVRILRVVDTLKLEQNIGL